METTEISANSGQNKGETAPDWLDRIGKWYWRYITPALRQTGILHAGTRELVAVMCSAYSTYRRANDKLRAEGRIVPGANGTTKVNPLVTVEKHAFEVMARCHKELKIGKSEILPNDELEQFLENLP